MKPTNRQKRQIVHLRQLRKSFKEISVIVGVTVDCAVYWVKKAGLGSFHATKPPDPVLRLSRAKRRSV